MNFDLGSKSISEILGEASCVDDFVKKSSMLDFHVNALEEEMRKIEAFKRELPHCMQLLRDAIERLKAESGREVGPLIYGEGEGRVKSSNDFTEKRNWLKSVQLCTPLSRNHQDSVNFHLRSRFVEGEGSGNFGCKFGNEGGAFSPFKKEKQGTAGVEGLSLAVTAAGEVASEGKRDFGIRKVKLHEPHQLEQQKKQRRCWSPELHKIFVNALHQLGGAQTATPKQIRELMKVDGLTNDEVKSHLQKYRIYIKRVDSVEQFAVSGSPQGPLQGGGKAGKGDGDDDDKSESHAGWKTKLHHNL